MRFLEVFDSTGVAELSSSSAASDVYKRQVLQDPNRRSIKKSNAAVTLYLNATNLNRLKQHAEAEEQKISWLIDEMIYEYLSDKL